MAFILPRRSHGAYHGPYEIVCSGELFRGTMTMAKTRAGNPASIPAEKPDDASRSTDIITYHKGAFSNEHDVLTVERPLEIHIAGADPLITMRTPGHDEELAAGL